MVKSSQIARAIDTAESLVKHLKDLQSNFESQDSELTELRKMKRTFENLQKLLNQETGSTSELPPTSTATAQKRTRRIKDKVDQESKSNRTAADLTTVDQVEPPDQINNTEPTAGEVYNANG